MLRLSVPLGLVMLLGACGDIDTTNGSPPTDTVVETPDLPTLEPEPEPITLAGSGQTASEGFQVAGGITIFRMTHQGSRNFSITLMDADTGDREGLLVNVIGRFEGSKLETVATGSYVMDVTADGTWAVTIEQPRPSDAPSPPHTLTGPNQAAAGPLSFPRGLARFEMNHTGDRNFAVVMYGNNGDRIGLLANEIGPWSGSKAQNVPAAGLYWFDITASGEWSIAIST